MQFIIAEYDRDYGCVVDRREMEFASQAEAEAWCEKESWHGYSYSAHLPNQVAPDPVAVRRFLSGSTDPDYPPL